jgi:hypothetical protein
LRIFFSLRSEYFRGYSALQRTGFWGEGQRFHASFFWSDAKGNEVNETEASHVAVSVRSPSADEKDCQREQQLLSNAIKSTRDGSFQNLGMFNH